MGIRLRCLLTIAIAVLAALGESAANIEVPWSTNSYGPDGPWHAVTVKAGGVNSQGATQFDLFPGGIYGSFLLTEDACSPYPDTSCGKGGTWTPEYETDTDTYYEAEWRINNDEDTVLGTGETYVQAMTINGLTVANVPLVAVQNFSMTSPGGTVYGSECGTLALGTGSIKQVQNFITAKTSNNSWAFEYTAAMWNESIIPSYSWMLHIGSANLDYDGSLILGGYDKGRTIGPYLNYSSSQSITLLDIGLGVEQGGSPFAAGFKNKTGLLVNGTGDPTTLTLDVDPLLPYLYLPAKTCEKLAEVLPLTYDTTLQYYLWNTEDSAYEAIMTSPSYLSFVFDQASESAADSSNVTIKIPLMLLNLTLSSPLVESDTQYFPCLDYTYDGAGTFRLGRAFLQSAFLGYNYNQYTGFLGQAAGPGLGEDRIDIADAAVSIDTNDDNGTILWDSWSGYWTALAEDGAITATPSATHAASAESGQSTTSASFSTGGLSTGALAGIVTGAVTCGILLAVGALLWWRRHRKRKTQAARDQARNQEISFMDLGGKCPFGCSRGMHVPLCPYGGHPYIVEAAGPPPEPAELWVVKGPHELVGDVVHPELDGRPAAKGLSPRVM